MCTPVFRMIENDDQTRICDDIYICISKMYVEEREKGCFLYSSFYIRKWSWWFQGICKWMKRPSQSKGKKRNEKEREKGMKVCNRSIEIIWNSIYRWMRLKNFSLKKKHVLKKKWKLNVKSSNRYRFDDLLTFRFICWSWSVKSLIIDSKLLIWKSIDW